MLKVRACVGVGGGGGGGGGGVLYVCRVLNVVLFLYPDVVVCGSPSFVVLCILSRCRWSGRTNYHA